MEKGARAAQQYFHLVVELFAEVQNGQGSEEQWIKIATRMSTPMVGPETLQPTTERCWRLVGNPSSAQTLS